LNFELNAANIANSTTVRHPDQEYIFLISATPPSMRYTFRAKIIMPYASVLKTTTN